MYNLFTLLPPEIIDYIWFLVHKTYTNNLKIKTAALIRRKRLWSSLSFKNVDRDACWAKASYDFTLKFKNPDFRPFNFEYGPWRHDYWARCYYRSLMDNHFTVEIGDYTIKSSSCGKIELCFQSKVGSKVGFPTCNPSNKFVYSLQCIKFGNKRLIYEKLAECLELSVDELSKIPKYKYTKNTKIQIIKHIMAL
jgi:hypothetical protein